MEFSQHNPLEAEEIYKEKNKKRNLVRIRTFCKPLSSLNCYLLLLLYDCKEKIAKMKYFFNNVYVFEMQLYNCIIESRKKINFSLGLFIHPFNSPSTIYRSKTANLKHRSTSMALYVFILNYN